MKTQNSIAIIAAIALPTTAAFATVFTSNTTIAIGNATYDGQPIVVSNCTLTVNGPHSFASLQVISNSIVTHCRAEWRSGQPPVFDHCRRSHVGQFKPD